MRFCGACGAGLERPCSRCAFVNPAEFTYCGQCGASLETGTKPPVAGDDLIGKHLPGDLKQRGLSERLKIEGERRQATVLFCDMEDFTSLSERIGAEDAYSMMEQVYEILIRKVYEFEGTVNDLTGDGIMALFGAPVALENAPERAIHAALAIHRGLARFNEEERHKYRHLPPVRMRVGINTGPVVVGTLGNDLRVEFKAVGDTVNLASRLEGMAEPGTTLVTGATFKLAEGQFHFEAMGERSVKGKEQPVRVYRVIAPSTIRTRFDVSTERGLTPYVGRERELEILLDAYQRAREGRGQAVSITAEAGLGKSRLLYELRKAISSDVVTFAEGRCLSYSRGSTYYPLIDLLRSVYELEEGDDESTVRARLVPALRELGVEESATLPWLIELLVASAVDEEEATLTPEARKAQLTRALTELLVAWSEYRPLVLAVEDLHWIDSNSEELLSHLLDSISGSRILMLLTYRPEYPHTWGARSYHSQLTLNRLSNRETLTMARHQLGVAELEEPLEELVLEKTEGVPFFVEEFLKSLRDLGLLELSAGAYRLVRDHADVVVPTTIQDVLRARVDLLPTTAKELLKTASVLGRETSHELLQRLSGRTEEDLLADLSVLRDAELFYERGVYPHSTYIFKHALTQEVVYDSLLDRQRRELHQRAGEAIESTHGANLAEHYGVLAEHFVAGEDFEKASHYSRLAARGAHHAGAIPAAIEYARRAVSCISRLPTSDDTLEKEIEARTTLAGYVLITGKPHEAAAAVDPIKDAPLALEDRTAHSAIFTSLGLHELFGTEDHAAAMQHLDKVFATPVDGDTAPWHWFCGYYLGNFLSWTCEFEDSIRHLEIAAGLGESAGNLASGAVARGAIGLTLVYQGRLREAAGVVEKALVDAAASHDPTAEALTQIDAGALLCHQGSYGTAKTHLLKGMRSTGELAQDYWRSVDLGFLGDTLFGLGSYGNAEQRYREGLRVLEAGGALPSWQNVFRLKLARARAMAIEGAFEVRLDELDEWRRGNRFRKFEGLSARLIAEILLTREDADPGEVGPWIEMAIAADSVNNLDLDLAHDYVCLAGLHRRTGDREAMTGALANARDLFDECGASGLVEEIERQL